jgi:hypothetical protein
MRNTFAFVLVVLGSALALRAGAGSEPDAPPLSKGDVLTWPRAPADRFGCFLEKELGHKDKRFNCDLKRYTNHGDPCRLIEAYHEGPEFPAGKVALVHPLLKTIELSWEHGQLQMVILTFRKKMETKEVWKELGIPDSGPGERPNVEWVSVQQGRTDTSLVIQGFAHMGSGDVDCDE